MIYIMLGGPATGKGTRANILAKELGLIHISTGELLREHAKENEEIDKLISNGEFVPDEVINKLLKEKMLTNEAKNGVVLDGYPRTLSQAETLKDMLKDMNLEITSAIELVAPKELVFKRILQRKECPDCSRSYGVDFPSKDGIHCDDCNAVLETRSDDTEETLTKRIKTYEEKTKPILDFYRKQNLLKTIDSSHAPSKIMDVTK